MALGPRISAFLSQFAQAAQGRASTKGRKIGALWLQFLAALIHWESVVGKIGGGRFVAPGHSGLAPGDKTRKDLSR
jgi:hypothetical protein